MSFMAKDVEGGLKPPPPPLSNDLYTIHMGLLKLEEILVVFTPIIVGYIAKNM